MTFGLMSKRPIPDELFNRWLEPARTNPAIRADLRKYAGDTRQGRRQLVNANPRLASFAKPVLVAGPPRTRSCPSRPAGDWPDRSPTPGSSRSQTGLHPHFVWVF